MSDETREDGELCERCGHRYPTVYRVIPDDLWKRISGHGDGSGLLCPGCCDYLAREARIELFWEANNGEYATLEMEKENARLRGIMREMVTEFSGVIWDRDAKNGTCVYCEATSPNIHVAVKHKSDCPIKQAMEVLGEGN